MAVITRYGEGKTRIARQPAVRWMATARPGAWSPPRRSGKGAGPARPQPPCPPCPASGPRFHHGAPKAGRHHALGVRRPSGALNGWGRALEKSWSGLLDEEQGNRKPWNRGSMEGMKTLLKRRAQYMTKTAQRVRLRRWKRGIRGMQPCVEGGQKQEYWSSQRENQASPDADKARLEEDGGSLRGEGGPFTRELKVLPSPLNNSGLRLSPVPFSATTKAGSWPRGW